MTRHNAIQEFVIMGLLLAVVGVVFLETGGGAPAAPGQLPPSAFPRLAGSVIAFLAAMRIFLILVARTERRATKIWRLRSFGLPGVLSLMMIAYFLLFDRLPFALLTLVFLGLAYALMGVRPVGKILLASGVGAGVLYVLFAHVLSIAV